MTIFMVLTSASLFESLHSLIYYYPIFAFVALLLAGLNVPFSEDIIIIGGALIAQADDTLILPCILAIYLGVAVSDSVSYFLGRLAARGTIKIKAIKSVLNNRYTSKLQSNLDRHGVLTFIACRFIPFGVRNTLFMSSGFFGLKYRRFLLFDVISSLISVNTLFWLVFIFGEGVERPLYIAGVALFVVVAFFVVSEIISLLAKALRSRGALPRITKYGLPQVAVFSGVLICGIVLFAVFLIPRPWAIAAEAVLVVLLIWVLSFFRDPTRKVIPDSNVLYSPCDGTVTDVVTEGGAILISVFLSLFNVHINRVPCNANVCRVEYKRGQFRNAMDPESARINESNEIELTMTDRPPGTIIVRQVSGAIARRIVCKAKTGDILKQGRRFGMIKFGSRTELIVPDGTGCKVCVKPGDKVKAGLTVFCRYES